MPKSQFGSANSTVKETATEVNIGKKLVAQEIETTSTIAGALSIDSLIIPTFETAPANQTAPGIKGTIIIEAGHMYLCFATNQWKRAQFTSWV